MLSLMQTMTFFVSDIYVFVARRAGFNEGLHCVSSSNHTVN